MALEQLQAAEGPMENLLTAYHILYAHAISGLPVEDRRRYMAKRCVQLLTDLLNGVKVGDLPPRPDFPSGPSPANNLPKGKGATAALSVEPGTAEGQEAALAALSRKMGTDPQYWR